MSAANANDPTLTTSAQPAANTSVVFFISVPRQKNASPSNYQFSGLVGIAILDAQGLSPATKPIDTQQSLEKDLIEQADPGDY
jgi:hypothetical protein